MSHLLLFSHEILRIVETPGQVLAEHAARRARGRARHEAEQKLRGLPESLWEAALEPAQTAPMFERLEFAVHGSGMVTTQLLRWPPAAEMQGRHLFCAFQVRRPLRPFWRPF
jgi:hypothetical protein